MQIPFRGLCRNIFHLGSGELAGRLCSIATVVWLGHRYGVVILGVYTLAQTVTQYLQPLIDFGLRHVGARLLALHPRAAPDIVARVQRRRLGMAGGALPLILAYSACANLPTEMRVFLFAFSAVGAAYAFSLDWAAWGQEKLYLVGWGRSIVPLSILAVLLLGRPSTERVLWYAGAGNAVGFLLQGAIFWAWWRKQPPSSADGATRRAVSEALAWRCTRTMGLAWLCHLAFNNIDVLMLGLMSNGEQVGLYGAAYRILNQVLSAYYLLTQVLYPRLARHAVEDRLRMLRARILLPLAGAGILIAAVLSLSRHMVLSIMFGQKFALAGPLLILLAWSIPLDFLTSYLANAFIAWGMERRFLLCSGIGAASNMLLNLAFIPTYGARGAALNTLVSYAVLLTTLCVAGGTAKELSNRTQPRIDAAACP